MNRGITVLLIALLVALVWTGGCTGKTPATGQVPAGTTQAVSVTTIPTPVSPAQGTATPLPRATSRPSTGTIISGEPLRQAIGELTLRNEDPSLDAVAALCLSGDDTARISVYIRRGEKYTFDKIEDGHYDLYLAFGSSWDPGKKRFTDDALYRRYSDTLLFQTISNPNPRNPWFHFTAIDLSISGMMGNVDKIPATALQRLA